MAQWTYGAWRREATPAAQLLMLRQHIEEVEEKVTQETSSGANSRSSSAMEQRLARLEQYEKELAAAGAAGTSFGGQARAEFTDPE